MAPCICLTAVIKTMGAAYGQSHNVRSKRGTAPDIANNLAARLIFGSMANSKTSSDLPTDPADTSCGRNTSKEAVSPKTYPL